MLKNKINKAKIPQAIAVASTIVALATITAVVALTPVNEASAQRTVTLYDGDLIKSPDSPDVYIVKYINNKWFKRLILNPQIFNSYNHLSWDNIKLVTQNTVNRHTTSHLVMEVYSNGQAVNGKVYYVRSLPNADTGVKHHVNMSPYEFEAAGLDWDSIYKINHIEAGDGFYQEGTPITRSNINSVINSAIPTTTIYSPTQQYIPDQIIQRQTSTEPARFRSTRSSVISGAVIKQNQTQDVAQYTFRSDDNDTILEDITLYFKARGGSSNNKNISETFDEITLLLDGDEIGSVLTDDDSGQITEYASGYRVEVELNSNAFVEENSSKPLVIRMRAKDTLTAEHYQQWGVNISGATLEGTYASRSISSSVRLFTVAETKTPFITLSTGTSTTPGSLLTLSNTSGSTKILPIKISNTQTASKYNSKITELQVQINLTNNQGSYGLRDIMKVISLWDTSTNKIITRGSKFITTSGTTYTVVFSGLNIPITNNSAKTINVRLDLTPLQNIYKTSKEIDSNLKLTASGAKITAEYTSNNKTIHSDYISGQATSETYQLLTSGKLSADILDEPASPQVSTELTEVAKIRTNFNATDGKINKIKIALQPTTDSNHRPKNYFSQLRLTWNGGSARIDKDISTSSSYAKVGNKYIITLNNLSINMGSDQTEDISVLLQAQDSATNLTSTSWNLSINNRYISGTTAGVTKYTNTTESKAFSIQSTTGNTEFVTISNNTDADLGSTSVKLSETGYTYKTILASTISNTATQTGYYVNINEITVNLAGSGSYNLGSIIESVSLCITQNSANCSPRSSTRNTAFVLANNNISSSTSSSASITMSGINNLGINKTRDRDVYVVLTFKPQSQGINETITASINGSSIKGLFRNTTTNLNSEQVGGTSSSSSYTLQTTGKVSAIWETISPNPHLGSTTATDVAKVKISAGIYSATVDKVIFNLTGNTYIGSAFNNIKLISSDGTEKSASSIGGSTLEFRNVGTISAGSNKIYRLNLTALNPSSSAVNTWNISMGSKGVQTTSNNETRYASPTGTQSFTVGSSIYISRNSSTPSASTFKADSQRDVELLRFDLGNRSNNTRTNITIPVNIQASGLGNKNIDDMVTTVKLVEGGSTLSSQSVRSSSLDSQTINFTNVSISANSTRTLRIIATVKPQPDNYDTGATLRATINNVQNIPGSASGNLMTFTLLGAPANLSTSAYSSSRMYVEWDRVTGANGYHLEYCKGSGCTNFGSRHTITSGSTTYKTITGLSGASTYNFRVRAYDNGGNVSDWSSTLPGETDLTPPSLRSASVSGAEITLSWSTTSSATDYDIQYCKYATVSTTGDCDFSSTNSENNGTLGAKPDTPTLGEPYIKAEGNTPSTDTNIKALKSDGRIVATNFAENTKYQFRVRSVRDTAPTLSGWSSRVTATTKITNPHSLTIDHTTTDTTKIAIGWSSTTTTSGAVDTVEYCKTNNNICVSSYVPVTLLSTSSGTGKTHTIGESGTALISGTKYKIRIRSTDNTTGYKTPYISIFARTDMAKPTNLSGTWRGGAADIVWDNVTGADSYEIYYCTASSCDAPTGINAPDTNNWTKSTPQIRNYGSNQKSARIATGSATNLEVVIRATRTKLTPNTESTDLYNGETTVSEWSDGEDVL